jgi:hypothetical protein
MLGEKTYGQSAVMKNRIHRYHPLVPGWRNTSGRGSSQIGDRGLSIEYTS